jgi:hypothetical protein
MVLAFTYTFPEGNGILDARWNSTGEVRQGKMKAQWKELE